MDKKKVLVIAVCMVVIAILIFFWNVGSSRKENMLSLSEGLSCASSPINEISLSMQYIRESGPICLNAGESFRDSSLVYRSSAYDMLDYQALEYQLYNDILPISSVEFSCEGENLQCSKISVEAQNTLFAYARPKCSTVPIEQTSFSMETPQSLMQFFDSAKECIVELKEITSERAESMSSEICPATKTGNKLDDLESELLCDAFSPIVKRVKEISDAYENQLPLFVAFASGEDTEELTGYMVELGILTGLMSHMEQDGTELYAFKNGAISRFDDGTNSMEAHLSNLKSEAQEVYDVFKSNLGKFDISEGEMMGEEIDESVISSVQQRVLDFMGSQLSKLEGDDVETAILRADFLANFKKLDGWIFPEGSIAYAPDNTEIKYTVLNCVEWLLDHPETESIWCGSATLNEGTTLSADDLPKIQNTTVYFESMEDAVIFDEGYGMAEFKNGVLRALQHSPYVEIGAYATVNNGIVTVTFTNA